MDEFIKVQTTAGEIEITARGFELNLEIFEVKENVRRLAARIAAAADDLDKIEELADAVAENIRYIRELERELEKENAE